MSNIHVERTSYKIFDSFTNAELARSLPRKVARGQLNRMAAEKKRAGPLGRLLFFCHPLEKGFERTLCDAVLRGAERAIFLFPWPTLWPIVPIRHLRCTDLYTATRLRAIPCRKIRRGRYIRGVSFARDKEVVFSGTGLRTPDSH